MTATFKALGFAFAQATTASIVGSALDSGISQISLLNKSAIIRVLTQFGLGIPLLGGALMLMQGGYVIESPIGDSFIPFWFYISQPGLLSSRNQLQYDLVKDIYKLFGVKYDGPERGTGPSTTAPSDGQLKSWGRYDEGN
jgi:hypothetical protein